MSRRIGPALSPRDYLPGLCDRCAAIHCGAGAWVPVQQSAPSNPLSFSPSRPRYDLARVEMSRDIAVIPIALASIIIAAGCRLTSYAPQVAVANQHGRSFGSHIGSPTKASERDAYRMESRSDDSSIPPGLDIWTHSTGRSTSAQPGRAVHSRHLLPSAGWRRENDYRSQRSRWDMAADDRSVRRSRCRLD
jgi:hypothetical protein